MKYLRVFTHRMLLRPVHLGALGTVPGWGDAAGLTPGKQRSMKYLRVFTHRMLLRPVTWWLPALLLIGVMLLALLPVGTSLGSGRKASLAYVTQRDAQADAGAVAVIDTTLNEVVGTVEVGPGPRGMAITSNGKWGYVATYGTFNELGQATSLSNTVSVLKLPTRIPDDDDDDDDGDDAARLPEVVATVKVGSGPLGVAITPNNKKVYVTNFGVDPSLVPGGVAGNTVSVIKTGRNKVVDTIRVGNLPAGVAVTPDGQHAYVTNRGDDTVSVINTKSHKVVATVAVQDKPANVVFTPDGSRAYVAHLGDPFTIPGTTVSVIDTKTNTVAKSILVGVGPLGVAVTPDGAHVYVVNVVSSNVSVIDTATDTVVKTVGVGRGPLAVAITPDGAHAYVTNFSDDTVSVIETATNTVVDLLPVAGGPSWVTVTGRHKKAHQDND
jgi:YVTN family beta-propeller protein